MKKNIALALLFFIVHSCQAQGTWLSGYRFRKLVTFNKSQVAGSEKTIANYMALVQVEDPALIYDESVFEQKLLHREGLDISFTSAQSPAVPLSFQLEHYDAQTGKLSCWVKIPQLFTRNEQSQVTTIYFYYGSEKLHNPLSMAAWTPAFEQVDHFNLGASGMITTGANFNGSQRRLKPATSAISVEVSVWIKPAQVGTEQIIFSNDTTAAGYTLKLEASGKLAFETLDPLVGRRKHIGSRVLTAGQWYAIRLLIQSTSGISSITIQINGTGDLSKGGERNMVSSPGSLSIGASKQGDRFFIGQMDEWRLGPVQPTSFGETDYRNQSNPFTFTSFGPEEQHPTEVYAYTFTGIQTSAWNLAINWSPRIVPAANKSIRVQQGKTLVVPANTVISQLLLEPGATMNLQGGATVVNRSFLSTGSTINGTDDARLQLQGDLYNEGQMVLDKVNARLQLYGSRSAITLHGSGLIRIRRLEIDLPATSAVVQLNGSLKVTSSLQIFNGLLKSDGHLQLLSMDGVTAMVYPLGRESAISGEVHVEHQVSGAFPAPSSGRGWRLLSSPVFQSASFQAAAYEFKNLQKSLFVTGAGGAAAGFDASPNNSATIYTHNQALTGTLAQKYIPIAHMGAMESLGRGFFVFSRGSRHAPNAYQEQMVIRPFVNAGPYLITYSGQLYQGPLRVTVHNRDEGGEGDGFNLLGNPYAAAIRWGSLVRENVSPYVWLFDPVNNSYLVSNDPETLIPSGSGFFIRVNPGARIGAVHFDESAKVLRP